MLKKGIIEAVDGDKATVRIPNIDKSLSAVANISDSDLTPSPISTLPGIHPKLQAGDIVILGFEDDNFSKPVILGTLLSKPTSSVCNITANSFISTGASKFNKDTAIGDVSPQNIEALLGYNTQLATDLANLRNQVSELQKLVSELSEQVRYLQSY